MTGVRPLTRAQRLDHARFLKALARSGNVLAAAREAGVSDGTLHWRRKRHDLFAQAWDAALAAAQARLHRQGGRHGTRAAAADDRRHAGGEPTITRLKNGRLQVRAARRGSLTKRSEQAFLLALSVTANVSLSAAAAGASVAAFNKRRRRDPGFAREMAAALASGRERLEAALVAGFLADSHEDDAWRHNEPPELPAMTPAQALQLLHLHSDKARIARLGTFRVNRRGDPAAVRDARVREEYRRQTLAAAERQVAAALEQLAARLPPPRHEAPIVLPDLNQVTGWSSADPAGTPHGPKALFGGWRAEHQDPATRDAALAKGRQTPVGAKGCGRRRRATAPAPPPPLPPPFPPPPVAPPTERPAVSLSKPDLTPEEIRRWLYGDPEEDEDDPA